jgi:uncharacterized protein
MRKNALIVFVRKPQKGNVKTRLAATIGEEAALCVYQKLLAHTAAVAKATAADSFIFYAGEIEQGDQWDAFPCFKRGQVEADLGGRMKAAFEEIFNESYSDVAIIGSDCPHLTAGHVQEAFEALQSHDVVIGPASDGGYYLLGMKKVYPALFEKIPWSTAAVYQRTIDIIRGSKLTFFSLPVLTDVDEEKDLPAEWRAEIKQRPQFAARNAPD